MIQMLSGYIFVYYLQANKQTQNIYVPTLEKRKKSFTELMKLELKTAMFKQLNFSNIIVSAIINFILFFFNGKTFPIASTNLICVNNKNNEQKSTLLKVVFILRYGLIVSGLKGLQGLRIIIMESDLKEFCE
ncbi:CLUMA_CG004456, isoform A [Clunio marinus]|uniref:CLUMA_CG004456, isoform A n=1 Tax=Clunio marinus TaxID=568069 RepID=A0A1J1HTQ9_9DIPT|nr:CLUMA_CG004456, isoform A [Clunio marinus]